jgi:predicted O-linked N-acetylglucosamine transferase (SPINDLY family)
MKKSKKTVSTIKPKPALHGQAMPLVDLLSRAGKFVAEGRQAKAVALYREWLQKNDSPIAYVVHFNLGVTLSDMQDLVSAEQEYRQCIELNPRFLQAHLNLGTLMERRGLPDEALMQWRKILDLAPSHSKEDQEFLILALNNLGRLLEIRKQFSQAEAMLKASLAVDRDQPDAMSHWVHLRQKQCKWPIYEPFNGITVEDMQAATSALACLSAFDDPAMQLQTSQRFVAKKVLGGLIPMSNDKGYLHQKLRIGYLSGDFCSHAVSILTAELFELHDRSRFDVYGFCWSREDGSALRTRVVKAFDHYLQIGNMSDEDAAKFIRSHEIDVLIDLQGLTSGTRPNILSYRPAPVQITYLGFPGPTALPNIDYVVADRFVLPTVLQPFFTEKPLYMPHAFQVNDRKREIGTKPSRVSCNLPEDSFIFCAFNNNFKFTPEIFSVWMRILTRVPNSVLWIVADCAEVKVNLIATAEALGIVGSRLVFADRVAAAEYLARFQVADLFLDTNPFNAGTTASDALWAGLPVLTYAGNTFASRMAGSLLLAADLPELITYSLQEYEEKAVSLANDRSTIAAAKLHLQSKHLTCPLFDSPKFVRDFEDLLQGLVKPPKVIILNKTPIENIGSVNQAMQLPSHIPLEPQQQARVINFMVKTVWGLTDPVRFYEIMDEALKLVVPGYYLGDNLMTWGRNNSLFDDMAFRKAWEDNVQNDADRAIAWRRYILACAAYHCAQLPGDFVECGVYRGTGIKTVIDYFGNKGFTKNFWGYDTYDYNPVEGHAFVGQEDGLFEAIQQRFSGYEQVRLVRGLLPDSLKGNSPEKICYLHIDLNSAKYEIAVLDALFDRVVPGGVIILDDYEWSGMYREQKIAEDAWFEQRQYRVFPLPTGQGLVLKR